MESGTVYIGDTNTQSTARAASHTPSAKLNSDKIYVSASKKDDCLHDLFTRFEAFNFDEDTHFQAGLSRISGSHASGKGVDQLKIKAFYYSKNVEPLHLAAYMDWSEKQKCSSDISRALGQASQVCSDSDEGNGTSPQVSLASQPAENSPIPNTAAGVPVSSCPPSSSSVPTEALECSSVACQTTVECQGQDSDERNNDTESNGNALNSSVADQELSFAEVAKLIQKGQPIPGLSQIDVLPTNEAPSPSQIPRAKKPWEG